MKAEEKIIRKTLDLLIVNAKTFDDLANIKFAIDDFLDEGYQIKDYIQKYNSFVLEFYERKEIKEIREKLSKLRNFRRN